MRELNPVQISTWVGVVAAFACGAFSGALRMGVIEGGTIAGALASCGLMFLDAALDSG
jgi:hypothetical protein